MSLEGDIVATHHVKVAPATGVITVSLFTACEVPAITGGGTEDPTLVTLFTDHAICLKIQWEERWAAFYVLEVAGFNSSQGHGDEDGERRLIAVAQDGDRLGATAGQFGVHGECRIDYYFSAVKKSRRSEIASGGSDLQSGKRSH